jgi:hypothetical protein
LAQDVDQQFLIWMRETQLDDAGALNRAEPQATN